MAFDFKKEERTLYAPAVTPGLVDVPAMTFCAVAGTGDPNEEGGAYAEAMALLYTLSFTVKMSKMGAWQPVGYFDYVVPPLEGLWWGGAEAFDGSRIADKAALSWVSLIRQPDFVTPEVFAWASEAAAKKKPELAGLLASGRVRLVRFAEGACAQVMHRGPYDDEPETIARLREFVEQRGLLGDITRGDELLPGQEVGARLDEMAVLDALDAGGAVPVVRLHHEIYLGDPRRTRPENLRTVIRCPVREAQA